MNDIKKPIGNNLGGVIRFNFIDVNDVESIPDSIDDVVSEAVVLKEGAQWSCGYGTQFSIGYSEPTEDTNAGTIYKKSFDATCPQDSAENKNLFRLKRHKRFILDIYTSNGMRLLVGTIAEPLKFSAKLSTKTQMSELAGYVINFSGDGTLPSPVYDI